MPISQKNKFLATAISFVFFGCSTSHYRSNKSNAFGTDIEVSPDRVIAECEFITDYEGDYQDPYGFMIHLLDDKKTVLTVSNGTVLEKEDCLERLAASEKIIAKGNIIIVRGRGDANAPIVLENTFYFFPAHGRYPQNGRSLNYLAIWNDKGQCYDAFYGPEKPCPREKWESSER